MDPKQTEGQGSTVPASQGGFSFSSGQPGSGQPGATQSSTLSTGANVSRTMDDLNVSDRKSATSNSPFAKHHFDKVAPGTGDIIISPSGDVAPSAPKQGINRGRLIQFGLIFGGIALVGLAIFTVVMVVNNPKNNATSNRPTTPTTNTTTTPSNIFFDYVSLLIFGKEGEEVETVWQDYLSNYSSIYAVKEIEKPASDNRTEYFSNLDQIWQSFISKYDGEYSTSPRINDVSLYFGDIANSATLTEAEIYDLLVESDYNLESTNNQINDLMKNNTESYIVGTIIEARSNMYKATASIMVDAKNNGCLSSQNYYNNCNIAEFPSYGSYQAAQAELSIMTQNMRIFQNNALSIISDLCDELIDEDQDDAASNTTANGGTL